MTDMGTSDRRPAVLLAGILLLAFGLRLAGIGWGLPDRHHPLRSYHPDEADLLKAVGNLNPRRLDFNPEWFNYPHGTIYLQAGWLAAGKFLGQVEIVPDRAYYLAHPEETARMYRWCRLLTVLIGTACVAAIFLLGRELGGVRCGFLAAALLAVVPMHVGPSKFIKPDLYVTLAWIVSGWLALRALRTGRLGVGAAVAAGLAAGMKYPGGAAVAGVLLLPFLARRPEEPFPWRRGLALAGIFAAAFVATTPSLLVDFGGFLDGVLSEMRSAMVEVDEDARPHRLFEGTAPGWLHHAGVTFPYGLGLPLALLAGAGLVVSFVRPGLRGWVLLAPFLLYFAVMGGAKGKFLRFMIPLVPLLCVWVARLLDRMSPRVLWGIFTPVWIYTFLYAVAVDRTYLGPDPRDEAAAWLEAHVDAANEPIGVLDHPYFGRHDRTFIHPPNLYVPLGERDLGRERTLRRWLEPIDPARLEDPGRPDWLVLSDYETDLMRRLPHRTPGSDRFLDALASGVGYREVARFECPPRLGPVPFPTAEAPHDWRYAWPEIRIYRRSDR